MGRIRTIKPEILTDEKAGGLSHPAWRLWVSMLVLADDAGRLPAAPGLLAGQVFWGSPADVQNALDELAAVGLVQLYRVRGQAYAVITGFTRHQKIDRASGPKHPGPEQADELSVDARKARSGDEGGPAAAPPRSPDPPSDKPARSFDSSSPRRDLDADRDRDPDLDRDLDREEEGEREGGAPSAPQPPPSADGDLFFESVKKATKARANRPPPSADAIALAEHLRQLLVTQKAEAGLSPHHLADSRAWASTRTAWAAEMQKLLEKAGRPPERARELLAWSFSDQGGTDPKYRTRVDSPGALVQKWDRIEAALARHQTSNPRPMEVGHYKFTGDEEYAGCEVEMPRAGGSL